MKKRLLVAILISCMTLVACGMSPSDAAKNGTAPSGNATANAGDGQEASDGSGQTTDASSGVVLDADPTKAASNSPVSKDGFAIKAGSVVIRIDDDFAPNYEAVGNATLEEGQGCLEDGFDTNYIYGDEELVVSTYAKSGQQKIYTIYVSSSQYETALGAKVGTSTKDDVTALYGEPSEYVGNAYIYAFGDCEAKLEFDDNGIIKTIEIINKATE